MSEQLSMEVPGRFYGQAPTSTERESGEAVEKRDAGPLKKGRAGHRVLLIFGEGRRLSAYEASYLCTGDYHSRRREATRLLTRGFLVKDGTTENPAPMGRPHVDAYVITQAGLDELRRLAK